MSSGIILFRNVSGISAMGIESGGNDHEIGPESSLNVFQRIAESLSVRRGGGMRG